LKIDGQVLSVDPPKLAQPLLERLKERYGARIDPGRDDADSVQLRCRLRLSGERRREEAASDDSKERSPVDHSIT
jgi:hypothetical protein